MEEQWSVNSRLIIKLEYSILDCKKGINRNLLKIKECQTEMTQFKELILECKKTIDKLLPTE